MIKKTKHHKKTKTKHTKKNVLLDNILKVANNVTINDLLNNSLFNKNKIKHKSKTYNEKSNKVKSIQKIK